MSDKSCSILSIAEPVEAELKEKASVFHSYLIRCCNHEEVSERQKEIKKKHANATHVCWAYRLLNDKLEEAFSDAGEPRGTAGIQILNVLRSYKLINVLCVVVRYFGGVKLGITGLIKAYKDATKEAVLKAKIVSIEKFFRYRITCNYEEMSKILEELRKLGYRIVKIEQHERVEIEFIGKSLPARNSERVILMGEEWEVV